MTRLFVVWVSAALSTRARVAVMGAGLEACFPG